MSRFRYAVVGIKRKIPFITLCMGLHCACAQAQQSNSPLEFPDLLQCQQFIPIARALVERIVDHIKSPRPQFKCADFDRVTWEGTKTYSIIRVAHPKFCQGRYCYTTVYNEVTKAIMFSMDAEDRIDHFEHAKDHVTSLKPTVNHAFENTTNGLLLTSRNGSVAVSAFNEILTLSVAPLGGK
jgi:hypothetical protein